MPKLAEFYEATKSTDDRFEIVAFHDGSVKSFAELDEKMAPIEKEYWKGKALPFPILLDATGSTIRRFGIKAFPTMLLLDPNGKLAARGNLAALKNGPRRQAERPGRDAELSPDDWTPAIVIPISCRSRARRRSCERTESRRTRSPET